MDEREAMAMSGAASFYMHRGFGAPGWQSGLQGSQGIRSFASPNPSLPLQSPDFGGDSVNSAFQGGSPASNPPNMGINMSSQDPVGAPQGEPVKKKRGRPRKYGPDGNVVSGLSSIPSPRNPETGTGLGSVSGPGSPTPTQKRGRGRPPGSGKKQQLVSYGGMISSSAGIGFTPHIISVSAGEDIAAKIMSFSQQGPRAVCILSASGSVSMVALRQSPSGTVTFEGHYEILSLSGTYVVSDNGGPHRRNGGLSVCLSGTDGYLIGGGVGGVLIAASQVQVIVGSFIAGGSKSKNKTKPSGSGAAQELPIDEEQKRDSSNAQQQQQPTQDLNPVLAGWPGSRPTDLRNLQSDNHLTSG